MKTAELVFFGFVIGAGCPARFRCLLLREIKTAAVYGMLFGGSAPVVSIVWERDHGDERRSTGGE